MLYTNPGSLTQVLALDSGIELVAVNALAAGGSGTGSSQQFTVSERPGGGDRNLTITAIPNGSTTVTADLEVSADGGVTFQKKQVGIALIATSVSTQAIVANVQAGLIYRLNVTTNTGGTAVTIVVGAE
jgi:hypothetical protein